MTIYIKAYKNNDTGQVTIRWRSYWNGRLRREVTGDIDKARADEYAYRLMWRGWQITWSLCKAGEWGARKVGGND